MPPSTDDGPECKSGFYNRCQEEEEERTEEEEDEMMRSGMR